jgi:DNA-binding NarL/FixJ family response regulator
MRGHPDFEFSAPGSTRVLLAESSRIFAEALMSAIDVDPLLEPIGYALDSWEALELVETLDPDVVVVGPRLKDLDGLTLAHLLNELWPRVRVLVLAETDAGHPPAADSLPLDRSADELLDAIAAASVRPPRLALVGSTSQVEASDA